MQYSEDQDAASLTRRRLLQISGISATALALGIGTQETPASAAENPTAQTGPGEAELFGLGVASGAPRPDGVVLWTRLAPEPLAEDGTGGMRKGSVKVSWEVATDRAFRDVVKRGTALAQADLAHSVHPRVQGLKPGVEYFYRFRAQGNTSPVGRFRTLPAAGTTPEKFSFGLVSCQAWYEGHYTAHKHLAQEKDLDLVLFVGDYIYEYGITSKNMKRGGDTVSAAHSVEVQYLAQYRLRYSLFKSDPHLQAVHARAACVAVWDDHEVQNNYVGNKSAYGIPDGAFKRRIAAGYRAFYENMPLDVEAMPSEHGMDITHGFDVGNLARFSMMDSRQFRSPAPKTEAERIAKKQTILGAAQEQWADSQLDGSPATWNLLAQGVVLTPISPKKTDQWDGYPAARDRMLRSMRKASNPVMLSGDIHHHFAGELKKNFDDPASETIGVELTCTSIASGGDGGPVSAKDRETWLGHPYAKLFEDRRGYVHVTLTPREMISTFWVVDWIEKNDAAPQRVLARYRTPAGKPGLTPVA